MRCRYLTFLKKCNFKKWPTQNKPGKMKKRVFIDKIPNIWDGQHTGLFNLTICHQIKTFHSLVKRPVYHLNHLNKTESILIFAILWFAKTNTSVHWDNRATVTRNRSDVLRHSLRNIQYFVIGCCQVSDWCNESGWGKPESLQFRFLRNPWKQNVRLLGIVYDETLTYH